MRHHDPSRRRASAPYPGSMRAGGRTRVRGGGTTMLVTNFRLKYILYKFVCGFYQVCDVGRIHPMRERSLRALQRSVDYIEREMTDALGVETQRDLIDFAVGAAKSEGHYLEFGVFTGGTIRFIAKRIGGTTVHGFDSF